MDSLADEVSTLKNRVAELEEEKGNLQLKLVDFEEAVAKQGIILILNHYKNTVMWQGDMRRGRGSEGEGKGWRKVSITSLRLLSNVAGLKKFLIGWSPASIKLIYSEGTTALVKFYFGFA